MDRKVRVSVIHTSPQGQSITTECYINPHMPLSDVLKDMAMLLGVKGPWMNYALRFSENDELVSDQSLKRKIKEGDCLLFVSSPSHLASQLVEDLGSEDEQVLKRATFSLQKFIKVRRVAFGPANPGRKKRLEKLQDVIVWSQGNTLAYALTSLHNLMEHDHGWDKFSSTFISTLVSIIVKQNLVNICRPATAIIIKLVLADKTTENSPIQCYGFDVVHAAVACQSSFLPTLVRRLSETDYLLQLNSMQLINVLFRKATEKYRGEFVFLLDALQIRKVVVGLMQMSPAEELGKQLVEFQRLLIQEGYRRKRLNVDTRNVIIHTMLEEIWEASTLKADGDYKWRRIGFETEIPRKEMNRIGLLGLETIHNFVHTHNEFFVKNLVDQLARPPEKRCPILRALSTGYTTNFSYQPLLLQFEEVNVITLTFFIRMWMEMDAQNNGDDINRVAAVVRSQFRHVAGHVQPTDPNGLVLFEREMRTAPYSLVRERQLKEIEVDDMLMSRIPVRNLRERLYKESYEFIKQQRIDCLIAGAWFPVITEKGRVKNLYRYYKLGPNKKFLHYGDFTEMAERGHIIDNLPKRVDMALVTDILTGSSAPIFGSKKNSSENPDLCFSLVSSVSDLSGSTSLADFVCSSAVQYSEWTDGFNMLLDKNIANRETAEYIHQLTEVGVKLALLDLTGEGIDIPAFTPELPELPNVWTYYYDENGGGLKEGLGGLASLAGMLGLQQLNHAKERKDDESDGDGEGEAEGGFVFAD
ncbi:hypothetical protein HDU96_006201 [Phlyctochytrium bullatum]|nr:hypothetical protein HDU96_006201 [Phlyctochytrium bullatum]